MVGSAPRTSAHGLAIRPWWAALLCALVVVCLPSQAFAWSCEEVPSSTPAASASEDAEPRSQLVDCAQAGDHAEIPGHLQAAICTLDGSSEVAPLPQRRSHDGKLAAQWRCPELVVSFVRPVNDAPTYTPPSSPADAVLLPVVLSAPQLSYAYEIHRRPVMTRSTPAHARGVFRPPR